MVRFSLMVIAQTTTSAILASSTSGLSFNFKGGLFSMNDDGSLKWRWGSPDDVFHDNEWKVNTYKEDVDGTFYVKAKKFYDGLLCALDGADGSVKWELPYSYEDFGYSATDGLVGIIDDAVYMHRGRDIDAIDKTGVVKGTWKQVGNAAAIGPDGSVVAYDTNNRYADLPTLTVLSQDIGTVKWSFAHPDLRAWEISEIGIFATVVNSAYDRVDLIYLDGHDGSVSWNVSLPLQNLDPRGGHFPRPVIGSNGEVYLTGAEKDGVCSVIAFDTSGNILRSSPCPVLGERDFPGTGSGLRITQATEDGSLEDIFVYSDAQMDLVWPHDLLQSSITAYSGITGHLVWSVSFPGEDYSGLSVGQDGTIFGEQPYDQSVVAIRNGVEAWRVNADYVMLAQDGISYLSKKIDPYYGTIVVMAVDKDGSELWSYIPQFDTMTLV